VRPKASGGPELRREMHAGESGCRGNIGKAHGLGEVGLDIVDGSFQSPSHELGHLRALEGKRLARQGQKPHDDGDAVRIQLTERAANLVGSK
jgi:hypothetical protein